MISMRQHAVSIAAIFLALAVGVVLGSGLLSGSLVSGLRDDKAGLQSRIEDLNQQQNQLNQQLNLADGFDAAVGGRIVRETLVGRTVVLITAPDADPSDLDGVTRLVTAAGGAVTGRVSLTDSFVDATGGDRLRTVVNNVIPAGITLKTGAVDQGSMAGDLLGSVLLLNGQSSEPQSTPEEMNLALDTLRSAGFITYDDGAVTPAQLAVVLTGDNSTGEDSNSGNRGAVVARFAGALDGRGAGTVLVGREGSAQGNGAIAVARADAALSAGLTTIDNIDRESGKITTPLALQEQLNGEAGRYGTGPGAAAVTVGAPPN
ncbi:outer membrane murein-binding lipoprotein Lpp [Rhodococcus sp. 27YEA15]|uniref:copper transporter n=1 Tax=Rhodococcus sp. 27YEA15 TaxID=3156259 RepID=UPI003C7C1CD6